MSAERAKDEFDLPACPVCGGNLVIAYDRYHQRVAVCEDCHSGLTIPGAAWAVAQLKREGKWQPKKKTE
jgi:ribosomal protein L34E